MKKVNKTGQKSVLMNSVILGSVLALMACNKDNLSANTPAVNAGECTQQFAVAYNDIVAKSKDAKSMAASTTAAPAEKLAKYQLVTEACKRFFDSSPVTSCKGVDAAQSTNRSLSVFEIKPSCDEAAAYVQTNAPSTNPGQPAPTPGPNPNPNPIPNPHPEVKNFERYTAEQIKVVIADLSAVKKAFNDQSLAIVAGKVDKLKKLKPAIDAGAVYCFISAADRGKWNSLFKDGKVFQVANKDEVVARDSGNRQLIFGLEDETLGFSCGKKANVPFTVAEVREAVHSIFDIRIVNE